MIKKEQEEFKLYHKNPFNLTLHVISGIVYMSALNILIYDGCCLPLYLCVILYTNKWVISIITFNSIFIGSSLLKKYNILYSMHLIVIFLIFCFIVPGLSHYITNEKQVLNKKSFTLKKLIINILFFLPFSFEAGYKKYIIK